MEQSNRSAENHALSLSFVNVNITYTNTVVFLQLLSGHQKGGMFNYGL